MSNSLTTLSVSQLKRAVVLKEKIEALNKELNSILGAPVEAAPAKRRRGGISAAGRARIAAAARARWARIKGTAKPVAAKTKSPKRKLSAAGRARIAAAAKARWAKFRAAK